MGQRSHFTALRSSDRPLSGALQTGGHLWTEALPGGSRGESSNAWRENTNRWLLGAWQESGRRQPKTEAARQRLLRQADLAFRQGFALCPYGSEAVFRYVNFLLQHNRVEDARLVAQTAVDVDPKNNTFKDLLQTIQTMLTR